MPNSYPAPHYLAVIAVDQSEGLKCFQHKEDAIGFLIKVISIKRPDDYFLQTCAQALARLEVITIDATHYFIRKIDY